MRKSIPLALLFVSIFSTELQANLEEESSYLVGIPHVPLIKSNFPLQLKKLCSNLQESLPQIDAASIKQPVGAVTLNAAKKDIVSTIGNLNSVKNNPKNNFKLFAALHGIKETCRRIRLPDGLEENDLKVLRAIKAEGLTLVNISDALLNSEAKTYDNAIKAISRFTSAGGTTQGGIAGVSSLAGIESTFVSGLADFISTRAKAEASLYLQTHLRDSLCREQTNNQKIDLNNYFSNLCVALNNDDIYGSLNSIGTFLKTAAQRDIESIPDNMLTDILSSKQIKNDSELLEVSVIGTIGYAIYKESKKGRNILDLLRGLANYPRLPCEIDVNEEGSICKSVKLLRSISLIYASVEQQENIHQAKSDLAYFTISALLSFEEMIGSVDFQNNKELYLFKEDLNFDIKSSKRFLKYFSKASNLTIQVEGFLATVKDMGIEHKSKQTFINDRLLAITIAFEDIVGIANIMAEKDVEILNVDEEKIQKIKKQVAKLKEISTMGEALMHQDTTTIIVGVAVFAEQYIAKHNPDLKRKLDKVKQVAPLVSEIANAESSDDVAKILEAAAEPVGSYRYKYKRSMKTITAFYGVSYGKYYYELDGSRKHTKNKESLFVPIGIHITKGYTKRSIGGFFSLLDLGGIVNKDNTSDSEVEENISLKQVFSPGVFFTIGLTKDTPLIFGAGVNMVNDLVNAKSTGEDSDAYRLQLFVAGDLTLFNL